jgi:hypothetical protein
LAFLSLAALAVKNTGKIDGAELNRRLILSADHLRNTRGA